MVTECSALTRWRSREGKDLFQLGQRADRGFLYPGDSAPGRCAQADRDRDGFLVIEQQRGQRRARAEPVTARCAGHGVHRVAEAAQLVHVTAQRPRAYT
jgi:hypothetical protein